MNAHHRVVNARFYLKNLTSKHFCFKKKLKPATSTFERSKDFVKRFVMGVHTNGSGSEIHVKWVGR